MKNRRARTPVRGCSNEGEKYDVPFSFPQLIDDFQKDAVKSVAIQVLEGIGLAIVGGVFGKLYTTLRWMAAHGDKLINLYTSVLTAFVAGAKDKGAVKNAVVIALGDALKASWSFVVSSLGIAEIPKTIQDKIKALKDNVKEKLRKVLGKLFTAQETSEAFTVGKDSHTSYLKARRGKPLQIEVASGHRSLLEKKIDKALSAPARSMPTTVRKALQDAKTQLEMHAPITKKPTDPAERNAVIAFWRKVRDGLMTAKAWPYVVGCDAQVGNASGDCDYCADMGFTYVPTAPSDGTWTQYVVSKCKGSTEGIGDSAHGHHIVMKGDKFLENAKARQILCKYGINPFTSCDNLVVSPNKCHSSSYAQRVLQELQKADKPGATKTDIIQALQRLAVIHRRCPDGGAVDPLKDDDPVKQ